MGIQRVPVWVVRCDTDPRHVITDGPDGSPSLFYSYETAQALATVDGWLFAPNGSVFCPTCKAHVAHRIIHPSTNDAF